MVYSSSISTKISIILACSLALTAAYEISSTEKPCTNGDLSPTDDCTQFSVCDHGIPKTFLCPEGLNFNKELNVCDYPRNAPCGDVQEPICMDGSTQVDPNDNSKFQVCTWGVWVELSCPDGLVYNQESNICDYRENVSYYY